MNLNFDRFEAFLTHGSETCRVMVLGDVMLDRYYYSEVHRISPEAPVPVAKVTRSEETLGGAANVAHNLAQLGCKVSLAGMVGNDDNWQRMSAILDEKGIDRSGLILTGQPTISKLRVMGAHQQMLRIDFEEIDNLENRISDQLKAWIGGRIDRGLDGVIISDYAKGVCTPEVCQYVIERCRKASIPILVDPKGSDWAKYTGATFISPNVKELGDSVGQKVANENAEIERYAESVRKKFRFDHVIVTRSEKGLTIVNSREKIHITAQAQEVFDVSGAGDTVAATFLAAFIGGLSIMDAAHLANRAAGIVVGKLGTYPIHRDELLENLRGIKEKSKTELKIMATEALLDKLAEWKKRGDQIVFTNGCFDILHAGHVIYLEKAKELGDHLIVGVNTDASTKRLKGPSRPVVPENGRIRVLAGLECVDCVVLFDEDTPEELIKKVKPDILVKGGDYIVETVVGREYAGRVEIIPFEEGYSTTNIIQKITDRSETKGVSA